MFHIKLWLGVIIFVFVLFVGVEFSTVNSDPVTVNYFLGTISWPLALVVVCAFTVGVVVAVIIGFLVMLPLRVRVGHLQRAVSDQENQIGSLRKKTRQGIQQA